MEKINTEILVSSLFKIGFDKVDSLLYTNTLGKLSIDNQKSQLFHLNKKLYLLHNIAKIQKQINQI